MLFLETKQLNPRQIRWLKEFACYDFAIKHIKSENNIGADALSRKPTYKFFDKLIKPMLVKNGNYMQVTEATEKNNDIIKKVHDTKLAGHQRIFKTLKRIQEKTTQKNIKADVEKCVKNCPTCAIRKHDRTRKEGLCYDLSLKQGKFAGNVCQGLRLAVWANVPWNVGNFQLTGNVGNVPDVSNVPDVHLIYIYRYFANKQFLFLIVNTFIY